MAEEQVKPEELEADESIEEELDGGSRTLPSAPP